MSKVYRISLICVMVLAVFVLCILLYRYEEHDVPYVEYANGQERPEKNIGNDSRPESLMPESQDNISVAANTSDITTEDTELIIVEHYPGGLSRQSKTELPEEMNGKTRNDLDQLLEDYCLHPESIDIEKGLYRIELTSFSAGAVTIEKSYHNEAIECYYLAFTDDCVTVYREDKRTVLLTTDIHRDQLSAALTEEILNFKLVVGNAELFDFLETYTS